MTRKFLITIPQILLIAAVVMLVSAVTVLAATGTTDSSSAPAAPIPILWKIFIRDWMRALPVLRAVSRSPPLHPGPAPCTT